MLFGMKTTPPSACSTEVSGIVCEVRRDPVPHRTGHRDMFTNARVEDCSDREDGDSEPV